MSSILKQLEILKMRLETLRKEDKSSYDANYRQHLSIEESIYRKLIENIEYQLLTPDEKQCKRILSIAKNREQNKDVSYQLQEINLYSKIRETIPYIMAVSYNSNSEEKHLTQDLLDFCENQLDVIDSAHNKRTITFPTRIEVENAFYCYTDKIKPNRIPSLKVYKQPEVEKKIDELYNLFLSLSNMEKFGL